MQRDPLSALLKLHRLSVDRARRDLAEHLQAERQAEAALHQAGAELHQQATEAGHLAQNAGYADAFALWLPRGQAAVQASRDAVARAEAATASARTTLGRLRAAARATEDLIGRRRAAKALTLARKEEAVLDEAGQWRGGTG